jgi:hypothetical protein
MTVQDTDDLDPLPFQPIDDQMRADWMNPDRGRKLQPFARQFGKFNQ